MSVQIEHILPILIQSKKRNPDAFRLCGCDSLLGVVQEHKKECKKTFQVTVRHERISDDGVRMLGFTVDGQRAQEIFEAGEICFKELSA